MLSGLLSQACSYTLLIVAQAQLFPQWAENFLHHLSIKKMTPRHTHRLSHSSGEISLDRITLEAHQTSLHAVGCVTSLGHLEQVWTAMPQWAGWILRASGGSALPQLLQVHWGLRGCRSWLLQGHRPHGISSWLSLSQHGG